MHHNWVYTFEPPICYQQQESVATFSCYHVFKTWHQGTSHSQYLFWASPYVILICNLLDIRSNFKNWLSKREFSFHILIEDPSKAKTEEKFFFNNSSTISYLMEKRSINLPTSRTFLVVLTEYGQANRTYIPHVYCFFMAKTPAKLKFLMKCTGNLNLNKT